MHTTWAAFLILFSLCAFTPLASAQKEELGDDCALQIQDRYLLWQAEHKGRTLNSLFGSNRQKLEFIRLESNVPLNAKMGSLDYEPIYLIVEAELVWIEWKEKNGDWVTSRFLLDHPSGKEFERLGYLTYVQEKSGVDLQKTLRALSPKEMHRLIHWSRTWQDDEYPRLIRENGRSPNPPKESSPAKPSDHPKSPTI